MKYIIPEMKIKFFMSESVVTEASSVVANEYVTELQKVENKAKLNFNELKTVTKFIY